MQNTLKPKQRRFIEQMETTLQPLEGIVEDIAIKSADLDDWLTDENFREAIRAYRKRAHFMRELNIARAAILASKRVCDISGGEAFTGREVVRRTWFDVMRLARPNRKTKSQAQPNPAGYHESVGAEEAEELLGHLGAD